MANLSNYAEDRLLDHLLGEAAFTMPSNVRVALYSTDPTDADTGTEISVTRQPLTVSASSGGASANDAEIVFPVNGGASYTVSHIGIRDATTGGNLLLHGPLAASKVIDTGDQFRISVGELDASLA